MTSLYVAFNRVYNAYDQKATYINVDAIYAIKTIEDYLIDEMELNDLLKTIVDYKEITCDIFSNQNYCKNIFERYNINQVFLVKLSGSNMPTLPNSININQTFKEYITYLNNAIIFDNNTDYVFIVETYELDYGDNDATNDEKDILNKYAYLEVK